MNNDGSSDATGVLVDSIEISVELSILTASRARLVVVIDVAFKHPPIGKRIT